MPSSHVPLTRRAWLGHCLRFGALGLAGTAVPGLLRSAAAQSAAPPRGTHVVLLGTQGGPNFNTERGESANALVVDGVPYVIDLGEGALAAMRRAGIAYRNVSRVFLTHLHDDHSAEVASFLSHQWSDGRIAPTVVAGPYGTAKLVRAALESIEANTQIRLVDEARKTKPTDIFRGEDLAATPAPVQVYRDERVTVSSVENTHFPESSKRRMPYRSLSYRFDCPGRSVVFSGDTAYSANLVKLARGADVFVCEAMEVASMRQAFERMVANGAYADNPEGVWDHIVSTHTSTADAGRMAAEAGVKLLVLTHLVPGALQAISDETYVAGVRQHFDGQVIVGKDLLVL
ncbi:MAG TPA: MBL fold metallo-hydrolase [Gammaproteobacteria bacterium]|nr:MBL fold metallo-hydrolase [Gammaproteobacteria bacterium]